MTIEEEIQELEREAQDFLLNGPEMRRTLLLKAFLLKNGYRMESHPTNARVIGIFSLSTGRLIESVSEQFIRYIIWDPHDWLKHLEQQSRHFSS